MLVYITTYASPKTANGTINICTPLMNTLFLQPVQLIQPA